MHEIVPVTHLTENQRRTFSCGIVPLDEYFKQFSKGNHLKNIGKTFVLVEDKTIVIGYYTLCMGNIDFRLLPKDFCTKLPKYPIPIARMARLAVNVGHQRKRWGEFLLVDALRRIKQASASIAAFGVVVDAKDEQAKAFYLRFGFKSFSDNDLCLFLPIEDIEG